jgi:hypothetical protein
LSRLIFPNDVSLVPCHFCMASRLSVGGGQFSPGPILRLAAAFCG